MSTDPSTDSRTLPDLRQRAEARLQDTRAADRPEDIAVVRAEEVAGTFDVVLSNHVLHHLADGERDAFLRATAALATDVVIHSDIRRGRLAYALYALMIVPFAPGTFLRVDGLRSIRRSYAETELTCAVSDGWRVRRAKPFRLLAIHEPGGAGRA